MSNRDNRASVVLVLALALTACGSASSSLPEHGRVGPLAGEAAIDRPSVVFRQALLTIEQLETPVGPPVTPGSRPSPATLASDAPDVVSISADGSLIAHRNGRAIVRSLKGGGSLVVEVLAASDLRAEPPSLRASPGSLPLPTLKSGDAVIPSGSVSWFSNAPNVAMVEDGKIRTGPAKGTATLTAVYGDARAKVTVVVGDKGTGKK